MQRLTAAVALTAITSAAGAAPSITGNTYNPALSLILSGGYSASTQDPADYTLAGFPLAGESGPAVAGFGLGESELSASTNIDHLYYGRLTAAFAPEGELEVEEAYIQTLDLGAGATLKAGRFLSNIGYLNGQHGHSWDFVDAPLAYLGMLGTSYRDDGVQLTWLAPTDLFLELSAEALRGDGYPLAGAANSGQGAATAAVHIGGDVGDSHSWRAGVSLLQGQAVERNAVSDATPDQFSGNTQVAIIDWVWKWAPHGNPKSQNLTLQAEWLQREEQGVYTSIAPAVTISDYVGVQTGGYVQVAYQFVPRWRVGLRYDSLDSRNSGSGVSGTALDAAGHTPSRTSLMVDFSASEYSRLRLQWNDDHSGPVAASQLMLQYNVSLGAHGAHRF